MTDIKRPHTTVILAMSADGKIAGEMGSAARFGSKTDKIHLERQISRVDAVIFGAGTLRAYQTSLPIANPELLQWRKHQGKPPQPVHIVVSASAKLNPKMRFFEQPIPRWLLTTSAGANTWNKLNFDGFNKVLVVDSQAGNFNCLDWFDFLRKVEDFELQRVAILGGGKLVASWLFNKLVDELWLTVCPLILGGVNAPTPVEGMGIKPQQLDLLSAEKIGQEIFLHYRLR